MSLNRSHEPLEAGQQLYALISHCRRPQKLWKMLASGRYDWLGVRADGRFVLGQPRLAPLRRTAPEVSKAEGADGSHRIEYAGPLDQQPSQRWYLTEEDARAAFDRARSEESASPFRTSGVWQVRLVVAGQPSAEELVVHRLPKMF
jgi:hypothetical protein